MQNDAFLEEIRSDPEDIIPRLVYADWLEENGDSQAELIRVQCELDSLPVDSMAEREELRKREQELLQEYQAEWVEPLKKLDVRGIEIKRGFVEGIRIDAEVFIEKAPEIVERVPALCSLNLRKSRKAIRKLVKVPELEQLRFLDLRLADLEDQDLKTLLDSPYLTNLIGLNLQGNRLKARGAGLLASCEKLSQLKSLNIAGNRIQAKGLVTLGKSSCLDEVTRLDAWNCHISGKGLSDFAATKGLPKLEFLDVAQNQFKDSISGFRKQIRPLKYLNISRSGIDREHANVIATTPGLANLRELRINGGVKGAGLVSLLTSKHLTSLQSLQAWMIHGTYSSQRLALPGRFEGQGMKSLRRLDLADNALTTAAFEKIARSGCLENVEELVLTGTALEDDGVAKILAARPKRLSVLWIDNNNMLTPKCLRHLAAWQGLRNLKRLILPNASTLDVESVATLLAAPHSEDLKIILMYHAEPTHQKEMRARLQEAWPDRFESLFVFPDWPDHRTAPFHS